MLDGKDPLLFASPERLAMGSFAICCKRANATFAIDEALRQLIGDDFRPEYRQLRDLRKTFPQASVHAYHGNGHAEGWLISPSSYRSGDPSCPSRLRPAEL